MTVIPRPSTDGRTSENGGYDAYFSAVRTDPVPNDEPQIIDSVVPTYLSSSAVPLTPVHSLSDESSSNRTALVPLVADIVHQDANPARATSVVVRRNGMSAPMVTPELLAQVSVTRPVVLQSHQGLRGALNRIGFRFGLSPAEQRLEERHERIRRRLVRTYQIAVISVKGGVGRTTTAAALGSTFASLRPDRVIAVDASPHFGDLAARTRRHPYGLTLRDLAFTTESETFTAVQAYLSVNSADLAVVAAPWSIEANAALDGGEFMAAAQILRRHFSLLLIDCGTALLDSATATVLALSDAAVVITPATLTGITGAAATLNWLSSHGFEHLVTRSVIGVVHQHPGKPAVAGDTISTLFSAVHRPTLEVPFDPHLAEGGEVDLRLLTQDTRVALEELAASLADQFPGFLVAEPDRRQS